MLDDGNAGGQSWTMRFGLGGPGRLRNLGFALLVLGLYGAFLAAVQAKFSGPPPAEVPGEQLAKPSTKVFVAFIDSLRPEDVPHLPFMRSLADTGFSAVIEPCADRLTRPCLKEAYTGRSSFGLLGAYRNLVADDGSLGSNVFEDLKVHGLRSAVVHHGEMDAYATAFTAEHLDERDEIEVLKGWVQDGFDLVVYNNSEFDAASHKTRVGTPKYLQALADLNAKLAEVMAVLPPEYEVIVFGDHGHTDKGRHIQGLDVPTVYVSSGTTFGRQPVAERLPIIAYRYLIGAKFGILPPADYEGPDLASHLAPDSELGRAAAGRRYAPEREIIPLPDWAWIPPFALLALLMLVASLRPRHLSAALVLAAAAAGSGAAYLWLVANIHFNINLPVKTQAMAPAYIVTLTVLAALFFRSARSRAVWAGFAMAFVTLPGTLYPYGLFRNLATMLSALWLVLVGPVLWDRSRPVAETRQRFALIGVVVLCVFFIAHSHVTNFELKHFRYLNAVPGVLCWLAWGIAGAAMHDDARRRWVAGLLAVVGATGWVPLGTYGSLVGMLACGVLLFRHSAWLACALSWLVPVWYGPSNGMGILCCIAFAIASIRACPPELPGRQLLGAITTAVMAMYTMVFTARLRMSGLDFGFAAQWFPGTWHERLWWIVALALTFKVILPAVMLFRYVDRFAPVVGIRPVAMLLCGARVCAGMLFLWALLLQDEEIAKFRLLDLIEDNVAWLLVLLLSPFIPSRDPAAEAQSGVPPGAGALDSALVQVGVGGSCPETPSGAAAAPGRDCPDS